MFKNLSRKSVSIVVVLMGLTTCLWYFSPKPRFSTNPKVILSQLRGYAFPTNSSGYENKSEYILEHSYGNASAHKLNDSPPSKIILVWTTMNGRGTYFGLENIDANARILNAIQCIFTGDKSLASKADMILFHGCFQQPNGFHYPPTRNAGQRYVYVNTEAPMSQWCQHPFVHADGLFNITATYKLDSDLVFSYAPPLRMHSIIPTPTVNRAAGKTDLAFWYVSNCNDDWSSKRYRYVLELRKFMKVDVYGDCQRYFPDSLKPCPKTDDKEMDECFLTQSKKYKFYLSFENALCRDYITEKLFKVLQPRSDCIPVVLGAPLTDYEKIAPAGSFIHVKNFTSPEYLAKYLKYLDSNDEAYNAYHKWRSMYYYDSFPGKNSLDQHPPSQLQKLCHLAHNPPSPKVWDSFKAWYSIRDNCHVVENVCTDYGICPP